MRPKEIAMKIQLKPIVLGVSLGLLLLADFSPEAPLGWGFAREAAALVGAPLTPVSGAGVARRTTRRVVAVEATAATSAAATSQQQQQQQQQKQQQQAAQAAPPPALAPSAGPPAVGTIVTSLPAGCVSAPVSGVEYYLCGGVYYRPAFQSNNLVYVVQKP
jgi:hypothetical protein